MRRFAVAVAMILVSGVTRAQLLVPQREVLAHGIVSRRDPPVRITLPKDALYVGADRWLLFDVADCEIYLFVEADAQKRVSSYYWIQFEAFIPSEPEMTHNYKPTQSAVFDGMEFDLRARVGTTDELPKVGSDLEHVMALLRERGYTLPAGMMNVRMVHLLDEKKRKELMVIYAEDVKPTGHVAQDLYANGKGQAEWPEIQKALIARAKRKIVFRVP